MKKAAKLSLKRYRDSDEVEVLVAVLNGKQSHHDREWPAFVATLRNSLDAIEPGQQPPQSGPAFLMNGAMATGFRDPAARDLALLALRGLDTIRECRNALFNDWLDASRAAARAAFNRRTGNSSYKAPRPPNFALIRECVGCGVLFRVTRFTVNPADPSTQEYCGRLCSMR